MSLDLGDGEAEATTDKWVELQSDLELFEIKKVQALPQPQVT